MASTSAQIEELLHKLDPNSLEQAKGYLEYLLFLQQQKGKKDIRELRLEFLQKFKGDAPFPQVKTSKLDVYVQ
jgi:hypothetical protein